MFGSLASAAGAAAQASPKAFGVACLVWAAIILGVAVFAPRKPEPPVPAPFTSDERASITKCAETWSAGWCADNTLRLREVLK